MTGPLTDHDVDSIRATAPIWIQLSLDRNWDTLLTMCDEEVCFLPPGAPLARGEDACLELLESFPEIVELDIAFSAVDGRGDFATGRGTFSMTLSVDGAEVRMQGKFLDTFRKQPDGTWRYRDVMWNTDAP